MTRYTFPADGSLTIEIDDPLAHPLYWWPETLLSYDIDFSGAGITEERLALINEDTDEPIPFQLSNVHTADGSLERARLHFITDLPAGGSRRFDLCRTTDNERPLPEATVKETIESDLIILDAGPIRVRLPASRSEPDAVPGPITGLDRGAGWIGESELESPEHPVRRIETERVAGGPLFAEYDVTYHFGDSSQYTATVRCVGGMEHVDLYETAEGIDPSEGVHVEYTWSGFEPTHRHAPQHPTPEEGFEGMNADEWPWERIDEPTVSSHHGAVEGTGPDGEFPFRLGPYHAGQYTMVDAVTTWDSDTGVSLGVFIDHNGEWNDGEYAIWNSSSTLQVRFFNRNGSHVWHWPVATGTRSTCIAHYDHERDREATAEALDYSRGAVPDLDAAPEGVDYDVTRAPRSHVQVLKTRYSTLDLDRIKEWTLTYPQESSRESPVFEDGTFDTPAELERDLYGAGHVCDLPVFGPTPMAGHNPVSARAWYGRWIDAYDRLADDLSDEQYRRVTGMYLLHAHICASEEFLPMRTMLSGHPNFLADVKSVPGYMAFLFPEHGRAAEWTAQFEAFVRMNARYHTRPDVERWDATGGRWTENIGCYVWAMLRPTVRAAYLLSEHGSGHNGLALEAMGRLGAFLVNILTAPFDGETTDSDDHHSWGVVTPETGSRRVLPPQGAHARRRVPPRELWLLGAFLQRYRPLIAERLRWVSEPTDPDFEHGGSAWDIMWDHYREEGLDDGGTPPRFKTQKLTSYGVVLRAGVGTDEEASVHLQQIDEGPNYRWGVAGEGGCGVVYYYANGNAYSHNGKEDIGDRRVQDTDFCCSFGVWDGEEGQFKSIGRNTLHRPAYDLDTAGYAEIVPKRGEDAYAWPHYRGRSVLLAGPEYVVIHDAVFDERTPHRFSWFVGHDDEFPDIDIFEAGKNEPGTHEKTELVTNETRGVWYDGAGDCLAVISGKQSGAIDAEPTEYGCVVTLENRVDRVFRAGESVEHDDGDRRFVGTAGLITEYDGGRVELALFDGERIGAGDVTLAVEGAELGVDAVFEDGDLTGSCDSPDGGTLRIEFAEDAPDATVAVDGESQRTMQADTMMIDLPPGRHRWELTSGVATPPVPLITHTEQAEGETTVYIESSATDCRIETSDDGTMSWEAVGTTTDGTYDIDALTGTKRHVRAIATNEAAESQPSEVFPVVVTDEPPAPPSGLSLDTHDGAASVEWGRVLGVTKYRLYRRRIDSASQTDGVDQTSRTDRTNGTDQSGDVGTNDASDGDWTEVYAGRERTYTDTAIEVPEPIDRPGSHAIEDEPIERPIYEYTVVAVNGIGESNQSPPVGTDPTSWRVWDPMPGERFRRRHPYKILCPASRSHTPYRIADFVDDARTLTYYPE